MKRCTRKLSVVTMMMIVSASCATRTATDPPEEAEQPAAKTVVWIDTDPSVAPGGHELDDGFALIQAFNSSELEIRGVSVVFGNAELQDAVPIAREILTRFGPDGLPLHAGAAGAHQLGEETDASRAMARALEKEPLSVLALGPVTNVATVLKNHPQHAGRIREIIAVAGRRPGQRFTAGADDGPGFRDFNFELDAEGFRVLLESDVRLVLAPWEISSKVWMRAEDIAVMESGNEATKYLAGPARDWLRHWETTMGASGFNPFDTLAVAYVTSPEWIHCEDLALDIQTLPDDVDPKATDSASEKPYLIASRNSSSNRVARYCYDVSDEFKPDLIRRLLNRSAE